MTTDTGVPTYEKDPQAVLDYGFDWEDWLGTNETIVGSSWTVPSGLTEVSNSFSGTATTIWLSSGTDGEDYDVINHIVSSDGREDDRTIKLCVRSR